MDPSTSQGKFLVATSDGIVFARVVGLGTMQNSVPFQLFIGRLKERGYRKYIFDLSECSGFDSTFMGILLGIVHEDCPVILVNVQPAQRRLLSEVGVDRVVDVCERPVALPAVELQGLETRAVRQDERLRAILDAHENLVKLDRRNEAKFGSFLELVRRELAEGKS